MARLSPAARTALLAALVAAGYYAGSRLGFVLRLPPATTSLLWPPNAILTAALLLSTPRRFWIWLLAALPAHALVQAQAGFPLALMAGLFATNCFEALLAAAIIHRFSDAPDRLDTLDRVTVFVVGSVLVAPFVSSFADAAVVQQLRGEPFETVWLRREFSNALSQLAIVPALLLAARPGLSRLRTSPRRVAEAGVLAGALVAVGFAVFSGSLRESPLQPGGALPLLLPLLIFAAVRFGPGGASLSLLATALIAIGTALAGWTPALSLPVEEPVRALQAFLIVVGVPLLMVATLIEERRQSALSLQERLRFEEFLSQLSAAFVHTPASELDSGLESWLERIGRRLGLDRVALLELNAKGDALVAVARWSDPPDTTSPAMLRRSEFPWGERRLLSLEPFLWPAPEELPDEATREQELLRRAGVRSLLTLPLLAGNQAFGSLVLADVRERREWPAALVQRCRLIADVLAGAVARRRAVSRIEGMRQELTHTLRVATIGELTTSLAHELNQPLQAIVANAQAARRMLAEPERQGELREIVDDLIEDGKRAGEVIHRLRDLLRKGTSELQVLDLNGLVRDVTRLLANDVMIRGVSLRLELAPGPLTVRADRVQLQQVLLNLVVNALDALADVERERNVVVRTESLPGPCARTSVEDNGPGLPSPESSDVFKPFYTTKAKGMGMGLAIARSILESHGGSISAASNGRAGASFAFTLPLAAEESGPAEGAGAPAAR